MNMLVQFLLHGIMGNDITKALQREKSRHHLLLTKYKVKVTRWTPHSLLIVLIDGLQHVLNIYHTVFDIVRIINE